MLTQYKDSALIITRLIQIASLAFVVLGFVWASSDLLLVTVLANAPVTPLSVLFMVYGLLGSVLSEGIARWITRSGNESAKKPENGGA